MDRHRIRLMPYANQDPILIGIELGRTARPTNRQTKTEESGSRILAMRCFSSTGAALWLRPGKAMTESVSGHRRYFIRGLLGGGLEPLHAGVAYQRELIDIWLEAFGARLC